MEKNALLNPTALPREFDEHQLHLSLVAIANENGVVFNDAKGIIFWVNDSFCNMLGYTAEEIIGKQTLDFCTGKFTKIETIQNIGKEIGKKNCFNEQLIHYRKNGTCFWGRVKGRSYKISGDDNLYYFAVIEDITIEKQKEDKLEILSKIAEENINAVILTDKFGFITWVNKSFSKITGYSLAEVINKKPGSLLQGPLSDPVTILYLRNQVTNGLPFQTEIVNYNKAGTPYWLRIQGQPIFDSHGELNGFFALEEDITSEKNAAEALKAEEEKYRNIIANMNLGLVEVDTNEHITFANATFCKMSGYQLHELLGKNAVSLLAKGSIAATFEEKRELRKIGKSDAYQVQLVNKSGVEKWWLISGAPRYNDKGELIGSIGIHLDITEQKTQEIELIEARKQAEHLAQIQEIFLANMSHEIRTPMNAIMGMSAQLSKTLLLPQQQFFLDVINSASETLLIIINDILDLSKIEAGKLNIESIGFNLRTSAQRIIQVLGHKAEEKGLILDISFFDENISPVLIGDPYRINQVLLNLVTNAVKFTEMGKIDLLFKLSNTYHNSQLIQIEVKDTGIGMDQSFLKHLFDKYSQETKSASRKYGGTGLGMSICKDLVELMGGEIFAESKKNYGTKITFTIELTMGCNADLPEKTNVQQNTDFLKDKHILITDDNELNRLVALVILQNYGANVTESISGLNTLDLIKRQHFDIILMDIQMPGINGLDTTRIIRSSGNNCPIIALTAEAIKGEKEKCLNAGMDDYITKPINETEFLKTLDKWIGRNNLINSNSIFAMSASPLYDLSSLKAISKDNDAFVKKMVDIFCEQTPLMFTDMEVACHNQDWIKLREIAHKMKPSIDNLKIISIKQLIRDIEITTDDDDLLSIIEENMALLKDTLAQVITNLKNEYPD